MRWNNKGTGFSITSHDEDMSLIAERCTTKWQVSKELQFQCDSKAQSQYRQTTVVSSNFNAIVRHRVDINSRQSWCISSMEHNRDPVVVRQRPLSGGSLKGGRTDKRRTRRSKRGDHSLADPA
jgi:hypothetical protein